jgi:hypothetical protein
MGRGDPQGKRNFTTTVSHDHYTSQFTRCLLPLSCPPGRWVCPSPFHIGQWPRPQRAKPEGTLQNTSPWQDPGSPAASWSSPLGCK